jgi:hypothetical protein
MWERNSAAYREREIGSGVKAFVKQCLTSADLFDLSEGELATRRDQRRHEFIDENATRAQRSADLVVYVSEEIVVPIEVERFGQITRGESQIRQYQLDLRAKLGILTDGFEWRFYNNRRYRSFTLDQLLSDPESFREFWQTYVTPEAYYIEFFRREEEGAAFDALPLSEPNDRCNLILRANALTSEEVRRNTSRR